MTTTTDLEEEIRKLEKEKEEAERALHAIDAKERRHLSDVQRRNAKLASGKRGREEGAENDDKLEDYTNNNESREDEHSSKRSRSISDEKNIPDEPEVGKQPKLTSTIVAPMSDKQKPDPSHHKGADMKTRNRKMFGVLVGTLNRFKTDINKKSEALLRREKLEKEVDQKVRQEQEALQTKMSEELKLEKEQALQKREELKQKLLERETELMTLKWNTQRGHLQHFEKTVAKPCIYYKPVDKPADKQDTTKKEVTESKDEQEDKDVKRGRSRSRSNSRGRFRSKSPADKNADSMQTDEK